MPPCTDFLCRLNDVFIGSGLLLEVISTLVGILIIVPLTARVVERDRQRRVSRLRKLTLLFLKKDAMYAVGRMKLAINPVEGALGAGIGIAITKTAIEAIIASDETRKKQAIQAIRSVQSSVRNWLQQADAEFAECHRLWTQLLADMSVYTHAMEPEEQTRLLQIRGSAADCASFCFTFSLSIRAILDLRQPRIPRPCDVRAVLEPLLTLIAEIGTFRSDDPWIIRVLGRVPGARVTEVETNEMLSAEERLQLQKDVEELANSELVVDIDDLLVRFFKDRTLIDAEAMLSKILGSNT